MSNIGNNVNKLSKLNSLIIYASTRTLTDGISRKLSITMKREYGTITESYHAGKKQNETNNIQQRFMIGEINIIVATIAFGMGLNKSNVWCKTLLIVSSSEICKYIKC